LRKVSVKSQGTNQFNFVETITGTLQLMSTSFYKLVGL